MTVCVFARLRRTLVHVARPLACRIHHQRIAVLGLLGEPHMTGGRTSGTLQRPGITETLGRVHEGIGGGRQIEELTFTGCHGVHGHLRAG